MSNSLKTTLIRGDNVRTGVTAIPPHPRNLLKEKLPGAVFVGNAFRKLIGAPALISGVGRPPSGLWVTPLPPPADMLFER
jgi:hypothetical protein